MDLYFADHDKWLSLYNCSFYDPESLPLSKRQHPFEGMIAIVMFVVIEVLYIPCLCVISSKPYRQQSCYKLMTFLGAIDVCMMPMNMLLSGIFAVQGAMFCTYPALIYAVGTIVTALWGAHMTTSVLLAVNRCFVISRPDLARELFGGRRTYYWILAPITVFVISLFPQPLMYNGVAFAYVVDPHLRYFDDYGIRYVNKVHFVINISAAIALPVIYALFAVMLCGRTGLKRLTSHREYNSFVQVIFLAVLTAVPSVVYVYFQFYPAPPLVTTLCTFAWFCIHGAPPIIYLTLNHSIRASLLWRAKVKPASVSRPWNTSQKI